MAHHRWYAGKSPVGAAHCIQCIKKLQLPIPTTAGLIAYMIWNILMIVLMIMIYRNDKITVSE